MFKRLQHGILCAVFCLPFLAHAHTPSRPGMPGEGESGCQGGACPATREEASSMNRYSSDLQILTALSSITESLMHFKIEVSETLASFKRQVLELGKETALLHAHVQGIEQLSSQQTVMGKSLGALAVQMSSVQSQLCQMEQGYQGCFSQYETQQMELHALTSHIENMTFCIQNLQRQLDRFSTL